MLCIQEELGNLKDKEPVKDNAVGINKSESEILKPSGWFDGLLGCLKPMLGIMGKGNSHDLKSYQGNYIKLSKLNGWLKKTYFEHFRIIHFL